VPPSLGGASTSDHVEQCKKSSWVRHHHYQVQQVVDKSVKHWIEV
jgi:hypothetical protein